MACSNCYATFAQFQTHIGETTTTDQTKSEQVLQAVSRRIDEYCNRIFYVTSSETRYYTPYTNDECIVDDMAAAPAVSIDMAGALDYGVTLTSAQFINSPLNAAGALKPWTSIRMAPTSPYRFNPELLKSVKVTATFGVPSTSGWLDVVREACLIQAARIFKRKDSPFGIAGVTGLGEVQILDRLDADVKHMLDRPIIRTVLPQ